jgi:aspartate ammonia-lyase
MPNTRTESDFLGTRQIPADALFGIHAQRAAENFPLADSFHAEWFAAMGNVKLAVYQTYIAFLDAVRRTKPEAEAKLRLFDKPKAEALAQAAREIAEGQHREWFIVPATQGGAGTSINMNINEIISNRALQILGYPPGTYTEIDPIEQANIYQSTNDVVPTALDLAAMQQLLQLEAAINQLRQQIETIESQHRHTLRIAYTQLQAAVPSTFGKLFSTYTDALSRDWWRISKCLERAKVVNLGGSAIGTSTAIPRFFVMELVPMLQKITKLPLTRSENLSDATSNLDKWVEIHGMLKAHAVNLEKIATDVRLLASDIHQTPELILPAQQVGSSIMPGKTNPVIPEYLISIAHRVYANDQLIASLAGQGTLELNAYLPTIGHAILQSIKLLIAANQSAYHKLFRGLQVNESAAMQALLRNPSLTTALSPHIGYHKAAQLARRMRTDNTDIYQANQIENLLPDAQIRALITPDKLLQQGFSIHELTD